MKFTQQGNVELDIAYGRPVARTEIAPSLFASATDALHDGIIVCDQEGTIVWINESAQKTCRVEWSSYHGKSIKCLVDDSIFPMDGIAEAFANNASMVYVEESHLGSDYIVEIRRIMEPEAARLLFVICFKHVNAFLQIVEKEKLDRNFASSLVTSAERRENFSNTVFDDDLERLMSLGVKAWTYGSRILITGESGVGKSQYARLLGKKINRSSKGFTHVNCASIPETLFESELFGYEAGSFTGAHAKGKKGLVEIADKGTLFLDEVGEIPVGCQSKVLRFLDDGSYMKVGATKPRQANVYIISATNRNLREMVEKEKFRIDLYFRLNTVEVRIPPLRERRALVKALTRRYLDYVEQVHGRNIGMTKRCEQFLDLYQYPGNIRELENALQHMAILCDGKMDLEHLPEGAREAAEKCGCMPERATDHSIDTSVQTMASNPLGDTGLAPPTLKEIVKKVRAGPGHQIYPGAWKQTEGCSSPRCRYRNSG